MKLLLVVNDSASSVTPRTRVVIQKALSADHQVQLAKTSRPGHASRLAQGAAADGTEVVVALGGDGTFHEVANGLAGSGTALAVLPGGSTNVFARTIGMTNDPVEAIGQVLSALAVGAVRQVNLGKVNGRYFLFHVGFGFDASVVHQVERRSRLKRYVGGAVFVAAALDRFVRLDRSTALYRVRGFSAGGESQVLEMESGGAYGICLNTDPYTYLGDRSLSVARATNLHTGLGLVNFERLTLQTLFRTIHRALRRRPVAGSHVVTAGDLERVEVLSEAEVPYQADGEYLGTSRKLILTSEPGALSLVVPLRQE